MNTPQYVTKLNRKVFHFSHDSWISNFYFALILGEDGSFSNENATFNINFNFIFMKDKILPRLFNSDLLHWGFKLGRFVCQESKSSILSH